MRKKSPRYVINPAASIKSVWFPGIHQILLDRPNKNYFNSLWIGTAGNALSLPYRLVDEVVIPLFNFRFLFAAIAVVAVPVSTLVVMISGIAGNASGMDISMDERIAGVVLSEESGQEALEQGCDIVVLDLLMLVAQDAGTLPEGVVIPGHPPKKAG